MVFEIYRERPRHWLWRGARWQWRLKADREKIIAYGQGYKTREQAEQAVAMIKDACSAEVQLAFAERQYH